MSNPLCKNLCTLNETHMTQPSFSFPALRSTLTRPFSHLIYLPFIRHTKLLPGDTLVLVGLGCQNKIPKSWWLKQ